jgi:hypothetical protein
VRPSPVRHRSDLSGELEAEQRVTSAGGRAVRHGGEGVDVLGVDPEAGQEVEYRFQARTDGETALGRQAADEEAGSVLERARLHADGSAPFPSPPRSNGGGPRS